MAGHSHWAGIKHRKGRADKQRSKIFSKLSKEITVAAKLGSKDPNMNPRLRSAMQTARTANMPKENIERAIIRASEKNQENYKEILFEGYAPYGVAVLVETATDNNTRTVANIRSYFNKYDGTLGTSGSVNFMFDHTCNFRINKEGINSDEIELDFIDFGAEEVFVDRNDILIYAPFECFGKIQSELEKRNIEIISSGFDRMPNRFKEVAEAEKIEIEKLLEKIEEDDDVQNVYHSMKE